MQTTRVNDGRVAMNDGQALLVPVGAIRRVRRYVFGQPCITDALTDAVNDDADDSYCCHH